MLGTRPEAIKLSPLILEFQKHDDFDPVVCSTGQHREMLDQVLGYFGIKPDIDLELMKPGQSLAGLTAALVTAIDGVINDPGTAAVDSVVVQGDTTTVMVAAVIAFYHRLPIVHVEAGLRTGDLYAPWPEEFNRRVAGIVATLHCAPTQSSADALHAERIDPNDVRVTGNTVIDALKIAAARERADNRWAEKYPMLDGHRLVLITGHRRENFGDGLRRTCDAITQLADGHRDVQFVYPVHLNPNVRDVVNDRLAGRSNIHLVPPAAYNEFVWLMDRADVVLTDSGGVQEEAPSLGAAVIVTREKTERPEAVEAGLAQLVGTDPDKIVTAVTQALADTQPTNRTTPTTPSDAPFANNPYGDGHASERIVDWMRQRLVAGSKH